MIVFIILFAIIFSVYYRNPKKLIVYHKYSLTIDILAWLAGGYLIFMAFLVDVNTYLAWLQLIIGSCLFNMHVARFIVRLKTQKK